MTYYTQVAVWKGYVVWVYIIHTRFST